jgi:multidrug efflux pump subunit AcrA (membrane-fusion protein)
MLIDGESDTPRLNFSTTNSQAQTDVQNGRLASRAALNAWRQELEILNPASLTGELDSALVKSRQYLSVISNFLIRIMDALDKATGLSSSTLDSYKAGIITARTNVNTAITNAVDQKQNIDSQKATIASEEAAIKSYEASIQNIEAQIAKTVLRSPIDGVVTKQDAKAGEIATAGTALVSVISASRFEIEANVPEVDIAGVKSGNAADITLDAYGNDVIFKAKVSSVDPAETVIEGVATYKVTLQFLEKDSRVKSGMTANIDILNQEKSDVFIIPQRLVVTRNGDKFVKLLEGETVKEIKVTTGLRSSDGNIEIIEGLKEGDKVVISAK